MREIFWIPDLSIWGNFEQLWFLWQKSPPGWGKFFWHQIYPFEAILSIFGFCGRKAPPPRMREIFFDTRSIHLRQFWATLDFVAEKLAPGWGNFLTPDLSIWGNFEQLWFLWQKSHSPQKWEKFFWHQIYPFQAILSNFGFCGRKAPPPKMREFFFDFRSIHLRQFWATLVFMAEKPPPRMRDIFLTPDLSIWGNFEQLWFLWQKSPLPKEGNFLTLDLSIWGNFEQLWFLWQKSPPPLKYEGNFFDTISIHLRQFWASLVFVAKTPPQVWGKFFDTRSIHFRQFWATLVFVAEKLPP